VTGSHPHPWLPPTGDIIHNARVRVQRRIDEAHGPLPRVRALLVDQSDDAAESRRGGRGAVDEAQGAVDCDDVVCAVGADVREPARGLRVVVLGRRVGRFVVREVGFHDRRLVGGEGKNVAEAPARVDDGFAGFFGGGDTGPGYDLRGADRGHVGACSGEGGVEGAAGAFRLGTALAAVAGDAVVAPGVEDCGACHAEFHVSVGRMLGVDGQGKSGKLWLTHCIVPVRRQLLDLLRWNRMRWR